MSQSDTIPQYLVNHLKIFDTSNMIEKYRVKGPESMCNFVMKLSRVIEYQLDNGGIQTSS